MALRRKDKIELYLDKLVKKYGNCKEVFGLRSRYYYVGQKVLRVSDHIGANSSGHVSIIVPSFNDGNNMYVLHSHVSGTVSVVPYEKVKEVVRSFFYMSSIFSDVTADGFVIKEDKKETNEIKLTYEEVKQLEHYKSLANGRGNTILGYPLSKFKEGHLRTIENIVNKIKNEK